MLLRVPFSTCSNFFPRTIPTQCNDLLNENFIFVSVTQFHLMTTREKWASNGEKCVAPTVPQYWILLMSKRTQNKKKKVKLNIEDLISQSLSYVIAPSTRDGRENVEKFHPLVICCCCQHSCCYWAHNAVCVIYNVSCVCALEWRLNCEAKCLTIKIFAI